MKKLSYSLLFFTAIVFSLSANAQQGNLVPNWSFDELDKKIKEPGQIELATGWFSPTEAKADLFSESSKNEDYLAPNNKYGEEKPDIGTGYAGVIMYSDKEREPRTYLQTELKKPLDPGRTYCVKFLISMADLSRFAVNHIGMHISLQPLTEKEIKSGDIKPQVIHSRNRIFNEPQIWETICGKFKAVGGEKYITIGNFAKQIDIQSEKVKKPRGVIGVQVQNAYYYIENVLVAPIDSVSYCSCEKKPIDQTMQVVYNRNLGADNKLYPEKAIEYKTAYFDAKQAAIAERSNSVLDGVVQLLKDNPAVKVEIQGHTSAEEEKELAAQNLSEKRAKNVYLYLLSKGIEATQLTQKGYKATVPATDDDSSAGRAQNRRVEFKIIE